MRTSVSWHDEKNQRIVKFRVEWSMDDNQLEIQRLRPNKVTFLCPETNSIVRSAGVRTARSRDVLRDAFIAGGQLERLIREIALRNNLRGVSNI